MNEVFADTSYFIALVSSTDTASTSARLFSDRPDQQLTTTTWVLLEFGNALANHLSRQTFVEIIRTLQADQWTIILDPDRAQFEAGLKLYSQRPDKDWSLTDCISFVVMQDRGINALKSINCGPSKGFPSHDTFSEVFSRLNPDAFEKLLDVLDLSGAVVTNLHWQLDVSFDEDHRRIRKGHGAENFSRLCRLSLNLLKRESSRKAGIATKRKICGWDNDYLLKVATA